MKTKKNGDRTYSREFWKASAAVHTNLADKLSAVLAICQESAGFKNTADDAGRDQQTDLALLTLVNAIADIELDSLQQAQACLRLAEKAKRGRPAAAKRTTTSNRLVSIAYNIPYASAVRKAGRGRPIKHGADGDKWTYQVVASMKADLASEGKTATDKAAIEALIDVWATEHGKSAIRLKSAKFNSIKSSYARGKRLSE